MTKGSSTTGWHLRRWQWVLLICLAPFMAGVIAVTARRWHLENEYDRELAALRAAGEPVTMEELEASRPRVAESNNAAPLILQAAKAMVDGKFVSGSTLPDTNTVSGLLMLLRKPGKPSPDILERAEQLVLSNRTALLLLSDAAQKPECRFTIKWDGMKTSFDHLTPVRKAGLLLTLEAAVLMKQARSQEAVAALVAALKIADGLREEPMLISSLVALSSHLIVLRQIQAGVTDGVISATDLRTLAPHIREDPDGHTVSKTYLGERAVVVSTLRGGMSWELYDRIGVGGDGETVWNKETFQQLGRYISYRAVVDDVADRLHCLRIMGELRKASVQPEAQRVAAASNVIWSAVSAPGTDRFHMAQLFLGAFGKVTSRDLRLLAEQRSARTAMAVVLWCKERPGLLPKSLEELVPAFLPAVPSDPFTGRPLRYATNSTGCVIYSVGENLTDEDGAEKSDVPFTVPMRP